MFDLFKKRVNPIGVDLGSGSLKMAQIGTDSNMQVQAIGYIDKPAKIEVSSGEWEHWAAKSAKLLVSKGGFKSNEIIAAIPSDSMFIDQVKVSKSSGNIEEAAFAKVKGKLPFDPKGAVLKYVIVQQGNSYGEVDVVVMGSDRCTVERHLAIYEMAGLQVKGLSVWPIAITTCFVKFFSRRQEEQETVSMLIDIGANHSNIAICRHLNLLFARMVPIGFAQLNNGDLADRIISEMDACYRYFESVSSCKIERLVFLSGENVSSEVYKKMGEFARRMHTPAQIGDVIAAVDFSSSCRFDRRGAQMDWATAFGLSLTGAEEKSREKVKQG